MHSNRDANSFECFVALSMCLFKAATKKLSKINSFSFCCHRVEMHETIFKNNKFNFNLKSCVHALENPCPAKFKEFHKNIDFNEKRITLGNRMLYYTSWEREKNIWSGLLAALSGWNIFVCGIQHVWIVISIEIRANKFM